MRQSELRKPDWDTKEFPFPHYCSKVSNATTQPARADRFLQVTAPLCRSWMCAIPHGPHAVSKAATTECHFISQFLNRSCLTESYKISKCSLDPMRNSTITARWSRKDDFFGVNKADISREKKIIFHTNNKYLILHIPKIHYNEPLTHKLNISSEYTLPLTHKYWFSNSHLTFLKKSNSYQLYFTCFIYIQKWKQNQEQKYIYFFTLPFSKKKLKTGFQYVTLAGLEIGK